MCRLALQVVIAGTLLTSVGVKPVCAQTPVTPVDVPTPAGWPKPVEDNRVLTYVIFDQLEGRANGLNTSFRWDGEGWIGTDFNKLWIKSEGRVMNGVTSDGDHEFLYDRPIPHLRYFDWQAGARVDIDSGPTRAWLALGVQGLAPYFFNFAPTLYVRDGGRVAGRISSLVNLPHTSVSPIRVLLPKQRHSPAAPATLSMLPAWCSEFGSGSKVKSPSKRWSGSTWVTHGACRRVQLRFLGNLHSTCQRPKTVCFTRPGLLYAMMGPNTSGLPDLDTGVRLRYKSSRKFAT